jgi:hypothetical protein
VLDRYQQDGLSFQRYLRRDQKGAGDDILAGNCMTIVGLYRNIYGVRPQWNRLRLDPRLTPELDGTKLRYCLRNQLYELTLGVKHSAITVSGFTVRAAGSFAVSATNNQLACFQANQDKPALTLTRNATTDVSVDIATWPDSKSGDCGWTITHSNQPVALHMTISGLRPQTAYDLQLNEKTKDALHTDADGSLIVNHEGDQTNTFLLNAIK